MANKNGGRWRGNIHKGHIDYLIGNQLQGGVIFERASGTGSTNVYHYQTDSMGFDRTWPAFTNLQDAKDFVEKKAGKGMAPEGFLCIPLA